ncbi:MAG: DUF2339 domain-containing protein [Bryobacterales bacterium]|nr:DUF2339 domain-containing protein [Bryobacterales bacterium]
MEWVALLLLIVLWRAHASRLNALRETLERQEESIRLLTRRVFELETDGVQSAPAPEPSPEAAPEPAPEPVSTLQTDLPAETAAEPVTGEPVYAAREAMEPAPLEPAGPTIEERLRGRLQNVEWEALIGGSWLNAIGVLVLVVGISLFLGYALTQFGPLGKISIGAAVSAVMIAAGVVIERRERYVIFGRGLLAGGWAALYFTAYAAYAVDAARVIYSPLAAGILLLAAACGMIAHSLRYRSQNLTLLAYFTAFFALQISAMPVFSIAASVPLAISLLTISRYLGWINVPLVGMVLTYFTFAFRFDANLLGPTAGSATLYTYWLAFEIHDLLKLRSGAARGFRELTVFPLNAMLFLGTAMMTIPPASPIQSAYFLATAGAVFLSTTVLRMKWKAALIPEPLPIARLLAQSHKIAVSFAAALFGGSLHKRFDGPAATIGMLMEAQLLILAGLRFSERYFRYTGAAAFLAAILGMLSRENDFGKLSLAGHVFAGWVPYAVCIAAQLYFNRWLTREGPYFTWGSALLLIISAAEFSNHTWAGVLWAALAFALVETAIRTGKSEFRYQAMLAGALAFFALWFVTLSAQPAQALESAAAGGCGAAFFYLAAFRLHRRAEPALMRDAAAVFASLIASLALWQALPAVLVAPAWGLLGLILLETGFAARLRYTIWQGHALILAALVRLFFANFPALSESAGISHRVLTVVPLLVLVWHAWRRSNDDPEFAGKLAARLYSWAGVIVLGSLLRFEMGRMLVVLGWAALMVLLLRLGWKSAIKDFLYQAYALAALTFFRGWATNFDSTETWLGMPASIATGVLTIAAFHAAEFLTPRDSAKPRSAFALMGSALLGILLYYQISGSLLTIAWGTQATGMILAGFAARERILRLAGLSMFLLCVLKLFLYDLRNLDTLSRILSFIVLGLVLMGASWLYMRFREKIQRYL